jgi:hypothetical protein
MLFFTPETLITLKSSVSGVLYSDLFCWRTRSELRICVCVSFLFWHQSSMCFLHTVHKGSTHSQLKTTSSFSKWHNLLFELFFEIKSSLPADKQHNFNGILRNHCDDNSATPTGRRSLTDRRRLKTGRYSTRPGSIHHCNIRLENVD